MVLFSSGYPVDRVLKVLGNFGSLPLFGLGLLPLFVDYFVEDENYQLGCSYGQSCLPHSVHVEPVAHFSLQVTPDGVDCLLGLLVVELTLGAFRAHFGLMTDTSGWQY